MSVNPSRFASLTLEDALAGLARGDYSSRDLTEAGLARIAARDGEINAFITVDADGAFRRADAADAGKDGNRPQLAGAPLAIKDNIMLRGCRATCASRILDNFVPPYDAAVIERLDADGAVFLGKTNLDEFAMGASGENSAYGATRNPWDPSRSPGGSSSGSAAAVAYGGCLAALGSDTGGSIRQPAAFCGLVGMKPTYGLVSRWGLASMASSLDQIGSITKTVRDNALLLDRIAGRDRRDSTSVSGPSAPCLPEVDNGVAGLRFGVVPALFDREGMAAGQAGAVRTAMDALRDGGAEFVEIDLPLLDYGVAAYYVICSCEVSANLARYDGVRYGVRKTGSDLAETYALTRGHGLGREVKRRMLMGAFALSAGYYDAYYLKAARVRRLLRDSFDQALEKCDALLLPVTPQPPSKLGQPSENPLEAYLGDIFTLPANLTGLPALSCPAGMAGSLPVGVQMMGRRFGESILYRAARVVEKACPLDSQPWKR